MAAVFRMPVRHAPLDIEGGSRCTTARVEKKRLGEVYLFHLVQDFDQSITLDNLATLALREEPLHQVIVERMRIGSLTRIRA